MEPRGAVRCRAGAAAAVAFLAADLQLVGSERAVAVVMAQAGLARAAAGNNHPPAPAARAGAAKRAEAVVAAVGTEVVKEVALTVGSEEGRAVVAR